MAGLTCSARAIAVSSTSLALTSRLAMSPAREMASCLRYSSNFMTCKSPNLKPVEDDYRGNEVATSYFIISVMLG
jgi:hypothetical protein